MHCGKETASRIVSAKHFIITTFCFILGIDKLLEKTIFMSKKDNSSAPCFLSYTFYYTNLSWMVSKKFMFSA